MNVLTQQQRDDLFFKMIVVSLALHLIIMLSSVLKAFLFPSDKVDWTQDAIRVDLVALPEKHEAIPISEPEEAAEPKKEIKKQTEKSKVNLSKKSALDRIKEQVKQEERKKRLEQISEEVAEQERLNRKAKVKELLVKGNLISKGNSLTGLARAEFNEFKGKLQAHVKKNWSLPEWLQNDTLKATVIVHIDFRGVVIRRYIEKSSGDPRFDEAALTAVDNSSPFPEPPSTLASVLKNDGIALGFPE